MERNKLISIRMPLDLLERIDQVSKSKLYVNRSWVIIKLLKALLECDVENGIWKIIHSIDPYSDGLEIRVTKIDKNFISK